ncbi:Putative methyltransferase [Giardia duodenalis]|uniref:Histone methyltransferase HMT1 n=2 Tax=Giardia intestinalis TaxID=5741 RepID=C6LUY1_GIAIB|nr:Histone methyltransferase HMT1 [Giardia intestinalis ATCC 50581]ESU41931.1 Putative methyltransferase [Giardia intestinalis]
MGKLTAVKQPDKVSAAVEPLRIFPYVYKKDELARMRKAFASAMQITEMDAVSLHYVHIKRNTYVGCKRPSTARKTFCTCTCREGAGCGPGCELRRVHLECYKECLAGPLCFQRPIVKPLFSSIMDSPRLATFHKDNNKHGDCGNQRLQRLQYARTAVYPAGKKGYGLFALTNIQRGTLVTEYIGEVITKEECMRRKKDATGHLYFLALDKELYIDAARKGNESRFINHSCDPNCEVQLWYVGEEPRAAIVALRSIVPYEELSFDYKFDFYPGVKPKYPCLCGSPFCRGYIDAPKLKA